MKPVSNKFKNAIKQYGRQIDTVITYNDGEEHLLDSDVLFSITPTLNGNILKSVMKQLEFESSVKVPKDTVINVMFGVQIDMNLTVAEINAMFVKRLNTQPVNLLGTTIKGFEYINLGNYIVAEEPEYNADTQSYSHTCYDKMLYAMKDYERLNITYPITVRNYINTICSYLGLTFKNINETFANYDKQVKGDSYDGYDYTFRDVLDELAQVTASTICINEVTDQLEIRYLNNTNDTIDEDYLKNVNVEFKEKYGPVNSIVLSRSGESDNVYLQDSQSIQQYGLCELKIIDNQIMNDNDRSVFLTDILQQLDGLEYYINDFDSPGITYYELCDKYTVQIDETLYNCVLLNDEIKITQGLEETIYTKMPDVSETDYSKADKTDRRINKAYIMVDKQNRKIESLVSQIGDRSQKQTSITQDIDGITQRVESIEDFTRENQGTNKLHLEDCAEGEGLIIEFRVEGDTEKFKYLTPSDNLVPSNILVPLGGHFTLVFSESIESQNPVEIDILADEPLRDLYGIHDELLIKNNVGTIIRKIGVSKEIADISYCIAGKALNVLGRVYNKQNSMATRYIKVYPNQTYYCQYEGGSLTLRKVCFYDENLEFLDYEAITTDEYESTQVVHLFTTPSETKYIKLSLEDEVTIDSVNDYELSLKNNNGEINNLFLLDNEIIEVLGEISIPTFEGDTYLYIKEYSSLSYYCKYITKNDYSDAFALQKDLDDAVVELNSSITQTATEINLEVRKKVGNNEVISKINQSSEAITINANRVSLNR